MVICNFYDLTNNNGYQKYTLSVKNTMQTCLDICFDPYRCVLVSKISILEQVEITPSMKFINIIGIFIFDCSAMDS